MVRKLIKCPQCGADNEENSNFCELCGEKLKSTYEFCPECGKENDESSKFCISCGASLQKSSNGLKTQNNVEPDEESSDDVVSLDLTPAETLIMMDQKTLTKELLKMTFIDLIFKGVFKLNVEEVEKKGIFGTKMVKEMYLYEGKNFNMPLKPHENVFRKNLPSKADSKRFKKLQQRVARSSGDYTKKKLLEPLALEGYFNVEKKFLGKKYSLSDKGIEAEEMIWKLKEEGRDLDNWIESDPERARAYLLMGGSNIFLTDDYYFDWFKDNSKKIGALFAGAAVVGTAYAFSKVRWYSAFSRSSHVGMDFDDFDDFGSFDDGFTDIFSDFDSFDAFDSMDFSDFDSGFDSGGFDGGGDGGGGGE
jgi:hypothetical protein